MPSRSMLCFESASIVGAQGSTYANDFSINKRRLSKARMYLQYSTYNVTQVRCQFTQNPPDGRAFISQACIMFPSFMQVTENGGWGWWLGDPSRLRQQGKKEASKGFSLCDINGLEF